MPARVITFYSYKGGVGRTQALANVAVVLANEGYRVIVVDMDLESPGLHAFFSPLEAHSRRLADEDLASSGGLLEFLEECHQQPAEAPDAVSRLVRCTHEALLPERGTLRLLPAGRMDESYPTRISSFSWEQFYEESRGAECMEYLREQLCAADTDFVLVDSRTGVTDVGSVCTFQLPDLVIVLFALHRQGIDGARRVGSAITESRAVFSGEPHGSRKRRVLFLPTRVIEEDSSDRRDEWISGASEALCPYGRVLARTGERIPHSLQVAYGEQVVVFPQSDDHLAVAYHRLTKVLLTEVGLAEGSILPAVEVGAAPTLAEVRKQFGRVQQHLAALEDEFVRLSPELSNLSSVLGWAQRLVQIPLRLSAALDRLDQQIQTLLGAVAEAIELPQRVQPDSLREWRAVAQAWGQAVERAAISYRRGLASEVRQRLLHAAEQDAHEVATIWPEVQALLDDEQQIEELKAHIPSFEQRIKQGSMQTLLQQNRLEQHHFERRGYSQSAWVRWLDDRLEKVEQDTSLETLEPILFNLLRLRAAHIGPAAPITAIHWAQYDFLCLYGEPKDDKQRDGKSDLDARYFEQVGQHLWRSAWADCFNAPTGEPLNFEPPAGSSCQAQVLRISEAQLDLVANDVSDWLVARAAVGSWSSIERLLSKEHRNPILRRAMHELKTAAPGIRQRLLALWLCETHPALERALFASYLHALIEQNQCARALLALGALLGDAPEIDQDDQRHLFDDVYVAALIELIESGRLSPTEQLLSDISFLTRLGDCRPGRILLQVLACGFCQAIPSTMQLGVNLRRHIRFSESFPAPVLGSIERHFNNIDSGLTSAQAGTLQALYNEAVAAQTPHMFGHQRFQRELQQFFGPKLAELLDDRRPQATIVAEIRNLDADKWIDATLRLLMDSGKIPRNRPPDDAERKAFVLSFNAARDCLKNLALHCLPQGGPPLSQQLAAAETEAEARQTIRQMLTHMPAEPLLGAIQRLL